MKLYHGSNVNIRNIDLSKSMKGKDFGQGFYLTENYEHAENIARIRCLGTEDSPIINEYEFDESLITSEHIKYCIFEDYTPEWATFVLKNRSNDGDTQTHDYDIVYGPIANDRVGQQIRRLLDGEISMEEFLERLKYMKGITFQYFFGTVKAINLLKKIR